LGFAQGVLSPLTSNALKFGFGMCFRGKIASSERGFSKGWGSSPDRRTCWQRVKRRDLRHDVTESRLREGLIADFPKLS
jgi:hypothetical protein